MKTSIIIATCNRADSLAITLESLCQTNEDWFSQNIEIIIADNASDDHTTKIAKQFQEKIGKNLIYVYEGRKGKSFALNSAIQRARGDILAFIDDDILVDPCWVKNIEKTFLVHGCDALGGKILICFPQNTPMWIKNNIKKLNGPLGLCDLGDETRPYGDGMPAFAGANIAVKKTVIDALGGFALHIGAGTDIAGEDTDFFSRLVKNGYGCMYTADVLVYHRVQKQKLKFFNLTQWYINSGRYFAIEERKSGIVTHYILGIPRYLLGETLRQFFLIGVNIFSQEKWIPHWKSFCTHLGMIIAYAQNRA